MPSCTRLRKSPISMVKPPSPDREITWRRETRSHGPSCAITCLPQPSRRPSRARGHWALQNSRIGCSISCSGRPIIREKRKRRKTCLSSGTSPSISPAPPRTSEALGSGENAQAGPELPRDNPRSQGQSLEEAPDTCGVNVDSEPGREAPPIVTGGRTHFARRSRAAARLRADWPSGNAPTTQVRRLILRSSRSSGLLVRIRRQCSSGKAQ
jgi:hypothetical protein